MTCQDPMEEMARRSLAEIDQDFGYYPGHRAAQAKGVLCRGWFTAGTEAGSLTRAVHFQRYRRTQVTARFSNFTANPTRHDGKLDVRGMATAFHLPGGVRTDLTALRMPRFFLGDAKTFLRWQRTTVRTTFDLPKPGVWAVPYAFRGVTPLAGWRQARPLCRVDSYAGCLYNALHAFRWVNGDGKPQYVRYSWVPDTPEEAMRLWQPRFWTAPHRPDPDYLRAELADRLARWPLRFTLRIQLAADGDPVDDARKMWPADRPTITVGKLELTEMTSWDGHRDGPLRFDPTRMTDGIEFPESDSLLALRKHVYEMSAQRRSAGNKVPDERLKSPASTPQEPPDLDLAKVIRVNEEDEIDICYDVSSVENGRAPLLLIMGFACPMTWWHPDFCELLEEKGFPVIRFDNRDCGRSTRCDRSYWKPSLLRSLLGLGAPYTVEDMADDAAGLLRKLEVKQAHVMGISLGGMVAQALAIKHPETVLSLTSINSCPKTPKWSPSRWPTWRLARRLMRPQPTSSRTRWIDYSMPLWRVMSGRHFPPDEAEHVRRLLGLHWAWSGGANRRGDQRQLCAVLAAPDRTDGLRRWSKPTAVIYGKEDPFVRPIGALETVDALKSVNEEDRKVIELSCGHYTPRSTWPQVVDAVDWVASRAEARAPA